MALLWRMRCLDGIFMDGRLLLLQCLIQSCKSFHFQKWMFHPKTFVVMVVLALVGVWSDWASWTPFLLKFLRFTSLCKSFPEGCKGSPFIPSLQLWCLHSCSCGFQGKSKIHYPSYRAKLMPWNNVFCTHCGINPWPTETTLRKKLGVTMK